MKNVSDTRVSGGNGLGLGSPGTRRWLWRRRTAPNTSSHSSHVRTHVWRVNFGQWRVSSHNLSPILSFITPNYTNHSVRSPAVHGAINNWVNVSISGHLMHTSGSKPMFSSHFSQKWFSLNYFLGINILLLLFQLSLIKTKQQTPLTLIDGKGYLHFLWGQASNWPGGDQECVHCPVSAVCWAAIIIHRRTPSRANSDKLYFLHLLISLSLYMLAVTMYKGATFDKTFNAAIQCREHHTFWVSFEMKLTQLILCWDFTIFIFWHLISILLKRSGVADSIQLTIQFPFSFPEQFCSEHRKTQHRGSVGIIYHDDVFVRPGPFMYSTHYLLGFKFWNLISSAQIVGKKCP